jgi:hypothetical protein
LSDGSRRRCDSRGRLGAGLIKPTRPQFAACCAQGLLKNAEKGHLTTNELLFGGSQIEPSSTVDLRDLGGLARVRRPFNLERVATNLGGIKVALERPSEDALAARLAMLTELDQVAIRQLGANLFSELALGSGEWILLGLVFALGD